MASTFSTNKRLELPAYNDYIDSWNVPVNADMTAIDVALGGATLLNATSPTGTVTLTYTQYRPLSIIVSGAMSADVFYTIPAGVGGQWTVTNGATGAFSVYMVSAAGGASVRIPQGYSTIVSCDGTSTGMRLSISTPAIAAGSTTQVQYNLNGFFAGSSNLTFDGTTLNAAQLAVSGTSTMSGNIAINKNTPQLSLNKTASGQNNAILGTTNGSPRWFIIPGNSNAESATAVGSDFGINSHDNTGVYIETPMAINRSTGVTYLKALYVNGGDITINKNAPQLLLNKTASGQSNLIVGYTNGSTRWLITPGNATSESGSNAGSNFEIERYNDSGVYVSTPLSINRASGQTTLTSLSVANALGANSITSTTPIGVASGGTGISTTPSNGQIPIGNGSGYTAATLTAGSNISITNSAGGVSIAGTGSVSSVAVSGGTTGLTTSGGPITSSGTITLAGTLGVANGGTGITSVPTNGQIPIGNGSGYTAAALTAGSNISITNSAGGVSIAASAAGSNTQVQYNSGGSFSGSSNLTYDGDDFAVTGNITATGLILSGGGPVMPTGAIIEYGGASAPIGWLLCNGAAVSRATYSALFAAIGTTYGAGNGSTTFNVPNKIDRVGVGAGSAYARGATGGATTATTSDAGSHNHGGSTGGTAITSDQMPSHNHTGTTDAVGDHTHGFSSNVFVYTPGSGQPGYQAGGFFNPGIDTIGSTTGAGAHSHGFTTNSTGGSQTHSHSIATDGLHNHSASTIQPYLASNYIIKT